MLRAFWKAGAASEMPQPPLLIRNSRPELLSDILRVRRLVEDLEHNLTRDPSTASRHGHKFGAFRTALEALGVWGASKRSRYQLIDELGEVYQLLKELEDELSSAQETIAAHGVTLQHLDIAMQILSAVFVELTISDGSQSLGLCRLKNLRVACDRALTPPGQGAQL